MCVCGIFVAVSVGMFVLALHFVHFVAFPCIILTKQNMPRHSVNVISLRRKQKVLFVDEVHEDAPIEEVKEASTGFSVQTK